MDIPIDAPNTSTCIPSVIKHHSASTKPDIRVEELEAAVMVSDKNRTDVACQSESTPFQVYADRIARRLHSIRASQIQQLEVRADVKLCTASDSAAPAKAHMVEFHVA